MKKLVCSIVCITLILMCCPFMVGAQTNHCSLFQTEINTLRWPVSESGKNAFTEQQGFSADIIVNYVKNKLFVNYYVSGEETVTIPAAAFEGTAKAAFAKVDTTALRTYQADFYNTEKQTYEKKVCFDANNNTYVFYAGGGAGDSTTYRVKGYVKSGNKYTVYSYFVDLAGGDIAASAVEGKDFISEKSPDGKVVKYPVLHCLKNVVETNGTTVMFHSWEQISAIPAMNNLITPDIKIQPTTTIKPTTTTKNVTTKTTKAKPTSTVTTEPTLGVVAQIDSVKLEAYTGTFADKATITVEQIAQSNLSETVKTAIEGITDLFTVYEINAMVGNTPVQPSGKVKATFTLPEAFELDKVSLLYIAPNGETEPIPCVADPDTNTITAELTHFSTYVLAQTDDTIMDTPAPEHSEDFLVYCLIGVAVLLALSVLIWYIVAVRRAREEEELDEDNMMM